MCIFHYFNYYLPEKQNPHICCLQETHFKPQDTYKLKVRGWKKIFHANGNQREARVAIFISDNIDLKIKKMKRNNEGHYIMIKGSIQEEDTTIVSIYAPNIGAPQYIKQTLTDVKGEIDSDTLVAGHLTFHLHQWRDHQNRKLIRKHSVK